MKKNTVNVPSSLRKAQTLAAAGQLDQALLACNEILEQYPQHQEALYLCSEIFAAGQQWQQALASFQRGFAVHPVHADCQKRFYPLLGKLITQRDFAMLEQGARWLTEKNKADGYGWDFLAIALIEQKRFPEAYQASSEAIRLLPDNPHVLSNLGNVLISLERSGEAVEVLKKAVSRDPSNLVALNNLGNALRSVGRAEEAVSCLEQAVRLKPDVAYVLNNLGIAYRESKQCDRAIVQFRRALELQPDLYQVYPNLIDALRQHGQVQEAITCSEQAMNVCSDIPEYWGGYGDALREANHLNAAIEAYIKALSFNDDKYSSFNRRIFSNLLFCLNYHPDMTPEMIYSAYQDYDQRFGIPLQSHWKPFTNQRDPGRRLKVGYVSQGFYNQVCKYFLIPLLEKHDHQQVEIFAYANNPFDDETTAYYKQIVDHWIPCRGLTDDQLAERIRADGIDILVDVAGHTNDNRLPVFARKPAPVSLHWLEYGYTTGLSAIDYYLTDSASVTDNCAHVFAEKIWCLDGPAYAYRPDTRHAEQTPLPCLESGVITFGSLSRSARINHRVVKIWAAILDAMPNSRLIINSGDFRDVKVQDEMASRFTRYGIDRSRLLIGFSSPSWSVLKHIDIGLDCFPHNSGTTLLESLYMGIPFISLADRPTVGRIGASVLTAAGHPEWIAYTEEEYAQKAIVLAHDIDQLQRLRNSLRDEMKASLLMDEPAFARSVEKAYRQMWQKFCEDNPQ